MTCHVHVPVHEQHLSAANTEVMLRVGCHSSSLILSPAFHSPRHSDTQEHVLQAPIVYLKPSTLPRQWWCWYIHDLAHQEIKVLLVILALKILTLKAIKRERIIKTFQHILQTSLRLMFPYIFLCKYEYHTHHCYGRGGDFNDFAQNMKKGVKTHLGLGLSVHNKESTIELNL